MYTLHEIVSLFKINFCNFTAKRWMKGGARHAARGKRGDGRGDSRGGWRRISRGRNRGNNRGGNGRGNRSNIHNITLNFTCYY